MTLVILVKLQDAQHNINKTLLTVPLKYVFTAVIKIEREKREKYRKFSRVEP